jgi:hypothetical protein
MLGGSIVLTLVLRHGTSLVESCFDALAFALEAKLQFVTPESIEFKTYRESQEQTKASGCSTRKSRLVLESVSRRHWQHPCLAS